MVARPGRRLVPLEPTTASAAELAAPGRTRSFQLRWLFGVGCAALALSLSLPLAAHDAAVAARYVLSHARGVALPSDFLNYYTAGRTVLEQPAALYLADLEAARQQALTGQPGLYAQFQNMPQVALLFLPLALLPYGLAYLLWAALNLALLAGATWLVAPRPPRWPGWAACCLWVPIVLIGYAPAQLALIDGQTAFVALFGFCAWVAAIERSRGWAASGALWLLTWAWKPQLLPMPVFALVLSRAVWRAVLVVGPQLFALALVVVWSGSTVVQRYVTLTQRAAGEYASGQTVLGMAQAFGEPGAPITAVAAGLGVLCVCAAIAWVWWGGLRADARHLLQLACLPLAAILLAPRAYAYELTLWLASAWLVLRFVFEAHNKRTLWLLPSMLGLAWLAAVLITLSSGTGVPWAAFAGLALLATLVWQYRRLNPAP